MEMKGHLIRSTSHLEQPLILIKILHIGDVKLDNYMRNLINYTQKTSGFVLIRFVYLALPLGVLVGQTVWHLHFQT